MAFEDYTTVVEVLGGDVVLVGEEHHNDRCYDLGGRVIEEYNPGSVALESGSISIAMSKSTGAMGALSNYAEQEEIPIAAIDAGNKRQLFDIPEVDKSHLLGVANTFSHTIQENGDLNRQAISDARASVKEEFGEEAWENMYPVREKEMAERIRTLRDEWPLPLVVGIGTFHIEALTERLDGLGERMSIGPNRTAHA